MSAKPAKKAPVLVGKLVRVARAGHAPVNHEGHSGKVLDIADRNRSALVDFGALQRWVPLINLTVVTPGATVAEPEGHDEHLAAIEAAL